MGSEKEKAPVPRRTAGDATYGIAKAVVSAIPFVGGPAAELFGLVLAPPLSKRRDEWLESVAKRLEAVEAKLDSLKDDPAFVTTMLHASQIALRTHQEQKLEALRNAVVNSAIGKGPEDDVRALFLNFVEEFTPTHLGLLRFFQDRSDSAALQRWRDKREVTDQMVLGLARNGLLNDPRPYAARGRDFPEALITLGWTLSKLGAQFIEFISSSG